MFTKWSKRLVDGLNEAAWWVVPAIKRNTITFGRLDGHAVVLKRRNPFGRLVRPLANFFFRHVNAPITMIDLRLWQRREVGTFRKLNAPFAAWPVGSDAICEAQIPGESLWVHLRRGTLTRRMVEAAGAELRHAHGLWSEATGGAWSHGDAAMCNVVYDRVTDRAYLIDFELMHNRELSAVERQADDLCVFLLDLAGFIPNRKWLPYALTFLRAYGDPLMAAELKSRLAAPRGIGRVWWKIRVNFVETAKIERRVTALQAALDQGRLERPQRRRSAGARGSVLLQPARR